MGSDLDHHPSSPSSSSAASARSSARSPAGSSIGMLQALARPTPRRSSQIVVFVLMAVVAAGPAGRAVRPRGGCGMSVQIRTVDASSPTAPVLSAARLVALDPARGRARRRPRAAVVHLPAGGDGHPALGPVRGGARPAARLRRAAVVRPRRFLGQRRPTSPGWSPSTPACPSRSRSSAGAVVAMVLARADRVPAAVRRTGIYFAMVTLAFAQMIYFVANQWSVLTGGENGLQGIPAASSGSRRSRPTRSTSITPDCRSS